MQPFKWRKKRATPRHLRVLALRSIDWGFTDASIPKLRPSVAELEKLGGVVQLWHNSLTARFSDTDQKRFLYAKSVIEDVRNDPDFAGFVLGFAEGDAEHEIDVARISSEALKNAKVQLPEPKTTSVTLSTVQTPRQP